MPDGKYVVYYRVSTQKQSRSKLGLAAQKADMARHINSGSWKVVGELQEVESGNRKQRPQLAGALRLCRVLSATLLVAKQDRLSRNAAQIMTLLDDSKVLFVCVEYPNTTKLNVGLKAIIRKNPVHLSEG